MFINSEYNVYLPEFFSSSTIKMFSSQGIKGRLLSVLKKANFMNDNNANYTFANFYDDLYEYLKRNYRTEYVYKNALANKIVLNRHSINTSNFLSELRVGQTKADVVILNGTSNVYEIKSEFDTMDRLNNQLENYYRMFDKIYVVISESMRDNLLKNIPDKTGIIVLTKRYTFKTLKEARSNKHNVDPKLIFKSFTKREYEGILKRAGINVKLVSNTQLYTVAEKIFCSLRPDKAHDLMVELLKRKRINVQKEFVKKVPDALKHVALTGAFSNNDASNIEQFLHEKFTIGV